MLRKDEIVSIYLLIKTFSFSDTYYYRVTEPEWAGISVSRVTQAKSGILDSNEIKQST